MVEVKAQLRHYRKSAKKVRLVADMVRGKRVADALDILKFARQASAGALAKLVMSAAANARHNAKLSDDVVQKLWITKLTVDQGPTQGRWFPRAHGSAAPYKRHSSHITVVLSDAWVKKSDKKTAPNAAVETPKKEESEKETKVKKAKAPAKETKAKAKK